MKKQITLLFVALMMIGTQVQSQNLKGQSVFTLGYGFNVVKSVVTADWLDEEDATVKGMGPIILGFDYGLADRFSLGLHFATQGVKGTITDHIYTDANQNVVNETFDYKLRRSHISIVPKFHYIVDNEKLDMYSGLRIGYVMWNQKYDAKDPNFPDPSLSINNLKSRVSVGLVAFGTRFYFTDNLGASAEICIGPPYVFSFGLNYKMGGNN